MTKDSISSMRHAIYLVLDCCNIPMTSGFLFQLLTMCQIYINLAVHESYQGICVIEIIDIFDKYLLTLLDFLH